MYKDSSGLWYCFQIAETDHSAGPRIQMSIWRITKPVTNLTARTRQTFDITAVTHCRVTKNMVGSHKAEWRITKTVTHLTARTKILCPCARLQLVKDVELTQSTSIKECIFFRIILTNCEERSLGAAVKMFTNKSFTNRWIGSFWTHQFSCLTRWTDSI